MAVRLTQPFGVNWRHVPLALAEGEVVPSGELANYLLETGAPVQEIGADTDVDGGIGSGGDRVPGGAVEKVLAWVGDDPGKAARALAVERDKSRPRTGLIASLEALAAAAPAGEGSGHPVRPGADDPDSPQQADAGGDGENTASGEPGITSASVQGRPVDVVHNP
jgi:hypothetical protein